ncbi:MAG TPA: hypothetical protein VGH97_10700 [Thermoanaerobaculia bacterium]
MTRPGFAAAVLLAVALGAGCASSKPSSGSAAASGKRDTGTKVLKGIVVEREQEAPGQGSSGFQGTGTYYLVFEVRERGSTAHYRYQVTHQQWFRYPEGSAVRITLRNNFLQDIQPDSGS